MSDGDKPIADEIEDWGQATEQQEQQAALELFGEVSEGEQKRLAQEQIASSKARWAVPEGYATPSALFTCYSGLISLTVVPTTVEDVVALETDNFVIELGPSHPPLLPNHIIVSSHVVLVQ
mgnify:FL=1